MTPQEVLGAIAAYRQLFEGLGVEKIDYPHSEVLHTPGRGLAHCHSMLDKMEEFVRKGDMEKAFRWLGFIQGVMWAQRVYSLDSLKNHNRLDDKMVLEPGWLKRDVERAVVRVRELEAKRRRSVRPVTFQF